MRSLVVILFFSFALVAQAQSNNPVNVAVDNFMFDVQDILNSKSVQERLSIGEDQELEITGIRKVSGSSEKLVLDYKEYRHNTMVVTQGGSGYSLTVKECQMDIHVVHSAPEPNDDGTVLTILYTEYVANDPSCSAETAVQ